MVCLAQFMVILDVSIVNVALPSIRDSLHFSTTGLQWVVNAYTLTFAGFLMLGGRASDLLGPPARVPRRHRALQRSPRWLCALSDSSRGLLIGARALQGIGGAVISPASLAIITTSFAEGRERNRALGVWGAIGGHRRRLGALLGGLLTQGLGWQWVFLVNVPGRHRRARDRRRRSCPRAAREVGHRHFDVDRRAARHARASSSLVYGIVRTERARLGRDRRARPDRRRRRAARRRSSLVEGRFATAPLVPLCDLHACRGCAPPTCRARALHAASS